MWTIRQEQSEAFRQYHLKKFEDEMVEHLKKFCPQQCKMAGEPGVRQVIRLGLENASRYGLTDRGPVRFYVELMFMFGSYFDTDPQHPWATSVLKDEEAVIQTIRADRLFAGMNSYVAEILEPEREHLVQSLQRMVHGRIEDYIKPGVDLEEGMLQGVRSACPLRSQYLGELVLRRLIGYGVDLASGFGFNTNKGFALTVGLTLAAGHGFYKDPQYGWIVRVLDHHLQPDAGKRLEELDSKSALYLEHILAGSED